MKRLLLLVLCMVLVPTAQSQACALESAEALYMQALTAYDGREYDRTIRDVTCAIDLVSDNPDYYNLRGNAYYRLYNDEQARKDYEKALDLDPNYAYAFNNIANLYYGIGDYDVALDYYNRALSLNQSDEIPFTNRGSLYTEIGKYEQAIADFSEALTLNPAYNLAFLGRAHAYNGLNDTQQAADDFWAWVQGIETTPNELALREQTTVQMAEGSVFYIPLDAKTGEEISITAKASDDSQRVDALIVVIDEQNNALIADDDSGLNLDAVIEKFVIPSDGTYQVVVSHAAGYLESGITGSVDIQISLTDPNATLDTSSEAVDTSDQYRLLIDQTAEVYTTAGDWLNLRSGPGLRFEAIAKLEKGTRVTLLDGARKADGYAWWRIRTEDGLEGWAVERVDNEQTLQLALTLGESVIVTSGKDVLNVRDGAGTAFNKIAQLLDGTRITLVDGPQIADGYRWWRIQTSDGIDGWVIDRSEGDRMIIPAKERE